MVSLDAFYFVLICLFRRMPSLCYDLNRLINTCVFKDFSMDIYLRQYWVDERLAYSGPKELVIGADLLEQIWLPDTFIGWQMFSNSLFLSNLNLNILIYFL